MAKLCLKKKSKRVSCKKKYKIEKKVRQHNKKVAKEARKKVSVATRKRKDPGVPNSFPFKDAVLKEAEERKCRLEEEKEKQKQKRKKEREKLLDKKRNLDSLVKDAQKRGSEYEKKKVNVTTSYKSSGNAPENSLKAYYKEFQKVVEAADVILQILDARDPLGSRCPQVEETVLAAGSDKKLVLVLNKIDLVPRENVEKWLKYLRNEFPTVAFKASTQSQKDNLSHSKVPIAMASQDLVKSSRCLGADMLMKLLGNYCRSQDIRTTITVGVVGFPNTGKSSLINSLKRSRACDVGATPGITRAMQQVHLDKHVKLLDSPGIVMASGTSETATILKNAVRVETLEDPITPVAAILKRCSKTHMMLHYNVADFSDVNEFLSLLARRMGRLKKGGIPDVNRAAKMLIQDWNMGKITYYTHPPEQHMLPTHVSAQIVTQMSKAFDVDSLLQDEQETLKGLKSTKSTDIILESSGLTAGMMGVDNEEADMEDDDEDGESENEEMEDDEEMKEDEDVELKDVTVGTSRSRQSSVSTVGDKKKATVEQTLKGNKQLNKARKVAFKRMKKQRKRSDKVASSLSDALESAMDSLGSTSSTGQSYSFATDFK